MPFLVTPCMREDLGILTRTRTEFMFDNGSTIAQRVPLLLGEHEWSTSTWRDPTVAIPTDMFRDGFAEVTVRVTDWSDKRSFIPLYEDVVRIPLPVNTPADSLMEPVPGTLSSLLHVYGEVQADRVLLKITPAVKSPPDVAIGVRFDLVQDGKVVSSVRYAHAWEDTCGNVIPFTIGVALPLTMRVVTNQSPFSIRVTSDIEMALHDCKRTKYWSGVEESTIQRHRK
ncbi:MAG: hypothetical protein D8M59_12805 [Planctomycetes bacterium]|nr:hypothetical protein [Planctomycetota bacterium]